MSKHIIPSPIREEAGRLGFNSVEYAGNLEGCDYYSVGCVDSNGIPVPTGLPTFVKYNEGNLEIISGLDGLDLCSRFY